MIKCHVCQHVCQGNRTCFRFPTDERTQFQWMSILGLTEFPGPSSRICCLHFSPGEFFHNGLKIRLKTNARPLPKVNKFIDYTVDKI